MWEYYLSCCEAAFRYQDVGVFQVQIARSVYAVPLTRDYIAERMRGCGSARPWRSRRRAFSEPVPLRKQRL